MGSRSETSVGPTSISSAAVYPSGRMQAPWVDILFLTRTMNSSADAAGSPRRSAPRPGKPGRGCCGSSGCRRRQDPEPPRSRRGCAQAAGSPRRSAPRPGMRLRLRIAHRLPASITSYSGVTMTRAGQDRCAVIIDLSRARDESRSMRYESSRTTPQPEQGELTVCPVQGICGVSSAVRGCPGVTVA
jgi:hypothetical protein